MDAGRETDAGDLEFSAWTGVDLGPDAQPRRPVVIVAAERLATLADMDRDRALHALRAADPVVIVTAVDEPPADVWAAADVVLVRHGGGAATVSVADPPTAALELADRIRAAPVAAIALCWLLRATGSLAVTDAIACESATYSTLLAGGQFRTWLAGRPRPRDPDGPDRVRVTRDGDRLQITLARPGRRNAVDAAMRDALLDALELGRADPQLRIDIAADGPSFCSGGDLDEFGTATDLAAAHVLRTTASVGRVIAELADRVTVYLHGTCAGAGIEIPAFAGHVVAAADASIVLPELRLGLIPGAGGTVSLPRRIGRHRTAWLALSGQPIDARRAHDWGLVDAIE